MKHMHTLLIIAITLLFAASPLFAAITVVSVKGDALYSDGGAFKPLQKGMQLKEGTKIQTGAKSQAVLDIDGHIVTIKSFTLIKVYKNIAKKDESTNSLGLAYGSINAKVKKLPQVKTSFLITTPVATSSVRGTEQNTSFGPGFGMQVTVPEGELNVQSNGENKKVGGNLEYSKGTDDPRSGDLTQGMQNTYIGQMAPGNLTPEEKDMLNQYGDQLVDSTQTPADVLDNTGGAATVNVNLIWNVQP
ncbi:MAG: FecR domain-containing protein [Spirochaetota bacterium]|nr:FecR domain-containing protein [Spirochaetota bacterium]